MAVVSYSPERAKIIYSYISPRTMGDFAEQLIISAAIKENLDDYKLGVFYVNDKSFNNWRCPR